MYKIISYYRAASKYPASARIIQATPREFVLFIKHDEVGTVLYRKGQLPDLEKAMFTFIPYGHTRPIFWKKVSANGN